MTIRVFISWPFELFSHIKYAESWHSIDLRKSSGGAVALILFLIYKLRQKNRIVKRNWKPWKELEFWNMLFLSQIHSFSTNNTIQFQKNHFWSLSVVYQLLIPKNLFFFSRKIVWAETMCFFIVSFILN